MICNRRGIAVGLFSWFVLTGLTASGQPIVQRTPMPEFTGERVYVRDVPDTLQALPRVIRELERIGPQTYFVVAIRTAGAQGATAYSDQLFQEWTSQATAKGLRLDPDRSVILLIAVDDHRAAVHSGTLLRERFGLDPKTAQGLIADHFAPLAREQKYFEAAASLLAAIQNTVARIDNETASVQPGTELSPVPGPAAVPPVMRETSPRQTAATSQSPTARQTGSRAGDLAWALIASVVAVGLIAAFLVWMGRRRARHNVEAKIKGFKQQAVAVMDHLDALKARLKSLPIEDPDFKEPMAGATLAMYEQAQSQFTGLWDRWLEVMDILDKAQAMAQKDSALGSQKLKEADKLVSDSKVFEQIEAQSKEVAATVDRLNQAHEAARAIADDVAGRRKEVGDAIQRVDKEGLPTTPYKPEIDGISAQAQQAGVILTPDPIGAQQVFDQARGRAAALRDRIVQILERFAEGREVSAALVALAAKVAEQRRQGLRLDEEGGNPDHASARAAQRLEALGQAAHAGDPGGALQHLDEAQAGLKEAQHALDSVLEARDTARRDLPDRQRETRRLREAMGQYEAFEAELARDFADSSWQAVAGHLGQARALLETFDRKTDEAAAAATPEAQHYLHAARLLGQVAQEQQAVFQLMAGVADQLNALRALREQSQSAARNLEDRQHAVERFIRHNDQAIGSTARATLESAERSRRQVEGLMREPRPDWPRIRDLLARVHEEYAAAESQAQADLQVYQQLAAEFERVRRDAERVRAFLQGHEEDRLAANQHYQSAEEALSHVQGDSGSSGGEWARLLEMVRGADADLQRSEQLAREDIRLARQAESEIDEAARVLRQARGYFAMGVTLGTAGADSALDQAQRCYHSQDYEQAIRAAAGAIREVRQAQADAAQQVHLRQMQLEAGRRRHAAAAAVGGMAAAVTAASRAPAAGLPETGTGPAAAPEAATASGAWSSETAEGSW
jgi:uncharacterized membrane protein YgcG